MNPSFCNYWFFSFSQVLLFDIQIRTLKNHQLLDSPIEPEIRRQIWRERRRTLLVLSRRFSTCRRTQCASSLPARCTWMAVFRRVSMDGSYIWSGARNKHSISKWAVKKVLLVFHLFVCGSSTQPDGSESTFFPYVLLLTYWCSFFFLNSWL